MFGGRSVNETMWPAASFYTPPPAANQFSLSVTAASDKAGIAGSRPETGGEVVARQPYNYERHVFPEQGS